MTLHQPVSRFLPIAAFALLALVAPRPAQAVDVVITCDNAYAFGYGPASGPTTLFGNVENCTAAEIFSCGPGPESYLGIPSSPGYLYVVTWSDGATTQGVLGNFTDGSTIVRTGQAGWQVYATGQDVDVDCNAATGPNVASVTAQVALANTMSGGANSSVGWVSAGGGPLGTVGEVANGELNDNAAGNFPIVCNILSNARWMWYNPDPNTITNPFRTFGAGNMQNDANEFLIFRIPSELATPAVRNTWGQVKMLYR